MHGFLALGMLAVALGTDAFSVAICVGIAGASAKQKIRLAAGFGVFQFLMPIAGLFVGLFLGKLVGAVATYIGGAILVFLGGLMIWKAFTKGFNCPSFIHVSFLALIMASIGVSVDALAVGIGYGMGVKRISILPASIVIGVVAYLMTAIGVELGGKLGRIIEHKAPIIGGVLLIGLGARILIFN